MQTATQTEGSTKVEANAKVIGAIKAQIASEIQTEGLTMATRNAIVSESKRLGYTDRKDVYTMVRLSWRRAKGLPANADEADVIAFDKDNASAVSNIMLLAWPTEKLAAYAPEVEKVLQHNAKNPSKASRVGLIRLHNVARGLISADEAINRVAPSRVPRGKTNGANKTGTPAERFGSDLAALRKAYLAEKLTLAEMREIAKAQFAEKVA